MTRIIFLFLVFTFFQESLAQSGGSKTEKVKHPNVILIITDDQGHGDLGLHGNPDIQTPVIDSLGRKSVRFTSFYVSPVCAPTRASLMTGRYALRTGVYDTYNGGALMAPEEYTLAELFSTAGYKTGIFGKWHLGDNYPRRPQDQGFAESLIHGGGGVGQPGDHMDNHYREETSYFNPVLYENGKPVKKQGYCSDIFTEAAISFIEKQKDAPYFLYLSYNAPHTPLQVPQSYLDRYKNLSVNYSNYPKEGHPHPELNPNQLGQTKKVYAMVSNIDDNLRKLFARLQASGKVENTVVIFMTDNGPQQPRYNSGYRGRKTSVYEGGIKVPFFISFPGQFPANKEINQAAAHIDVLPTLAQVCQIPLPKGVTLDGKSLLPLIQNKEVSWKDRSLFFEWTRGFPEPYQNIAVRRGDYKLVAPEGKEKFELFNLKDDPKELKDISQSQPRIADELKAEFVKWYDEVIVNPHLTEKQRIFIGTSNENPVVLNRNDWRGPAGKKWSSPKAFGYWDVALKEAGDYVFTLHFKDKLSKPGKLLVRLGTIQRTVANQDTTQQTLSLPPVHLTKGQYMLEAWYEESWEDIISPFYVEVQKIKK